MIDHLPDKPLKTVIFTKSTLLDWTAVEYFQSVPACTLKMEQKLINFCYIVAWFLVICKETVLYVESVHFFLTSRVCTPQMNGPLLQQNVLQDRDSKSL